MKNRRITISSTHGDQNENSAFPQPDQENTASTAHASAGLDEPTTKQIGVRSSRAIADGQSFPTDILTTSEMEQQRIGHELHDGLCQELAGIAIAVHTIQRQAAAGVAIDPAELGAITELLQNAVRNARGFAHRLYPVGAQPNALPVALSRLAAHTSERFSVDCQFSSPPIPAVLDPIAATHLYRIAQDAVHHAILSAGASRVVIDLAQKPASLQLIVAANRSSSGNPDARDEGFPTPLMQFRAQMIGAKLQFQTDPDTAGTGLTCTFPLGIT